jgi:pantetheine-phosphate adenylyltransferase
VQEQEYHMRAIYTGSFDPVTNGHLDIISRVAPLVDSLIVAVAVNLQKQPMFRDDERVAMLSEVCRPWPNVEVSAFHGLVVEAAREVNAQLIIRGIRCAAEFDNEMQMAQVNRALTGIETLLLPASPQWAFVSSSLVKELARFGGDFSAYVPPIVFERMQEYLQQR